MMRVVAAVSVEGDALVAWGLPVVSGDDGPMVAVDSDALGADVELPSTLDAEWCERLRFTGKVGSTVVLRTAGAKTDVVLVGVGPTARLVGNAGLESLRRAVAAFVRSASGGERAAFVMPVVEGIGIEVATEAVAEAAILTSYRYDVLRSEDAPAGLGELVVVVPGDLDAAEAGVARGTEIASGVTLARDLVNEPAATLTPERFAEVFVGRLASIPGVDVEVWDLARIRQERLGGLLGVAAGSTNEPRVLRATYEPPASVPSGGRVPHVALVGKGITFDTGGLSLKTAGGMETMKTDMGGAAAVFAALEAAARLGAPMRISAWAMLTENMPSGTATKPGDVLTTRKGKTIEVLNTDAEGRLVLSDGLQLAVEAEPDAIIDLATLTGACIVALGDEIAGVMGTGDALVNEIRRASERAGESLWPLPLPEDYRSHIDSEIADMKNIGKAGQAGTISAALLLKEFVDDVPWAHLDIAGPSRADGDRRYLTRGGTGYGVRTLVQLLTSGEFAASLID